MLWNVPLRIKSESEVNIVANLTHMLDFKAQTIIQDIGLLVYSDI